MPGGPQAGSRSRPSTRQRLVAVGSGIVDWVLVDLDRSLLTAGLTLLAFLAVLWVQLAGALDVRGNPTPLLYLFSTLVGGNVTLITIVISINQLILSRELRSPRELETEMHAAAEFRDAVEAESETLVVPEKPPEFLHLLVVDTRDVLNAVADATDDVDSEALRVDLEGLVDTLRAELDETTRRLEQSGNGVFPALSTILDVDFETHLNRVRWLGRAYEDETAESTEELFRDLEDHLKQLDVARQYFKTIYIKQELATVSTLVMSTGFFAVVVAIVSLVVTGYAATPFPVRNVRLLVPVAVAVNVLPLALLISYVYRIATVARRTAAITPFLAPTE